MIQSTAASSPPLSEPTPPSPAVLSLPTTAPPPLKQPTPVSACVDDELTKPHMVHSTALKLSTDETRGQEQRYPLEQDGHKQMQQASLSSGAEKTISEPTSSKLSDISPQYYTPVSVLNLELQQTSHDPHLTSVLGGYDEDFLEELPDYFECPICKLALRDPQVIDCSCGSNYCTSCLQGLMKEHGMKCAVCNDIFEGHIANKKLKRQVENLKVQCRLNQFGCEWIGDLQYLEKHINNAKICISTTSEE